MRTLAFSAVALALYGAAAASAAPKPPNPCSVITASDAASVLKGSPAATKPKTTASGRTCTYTVKHMSLEIETRSVSSASVFQTTAQSLPAPVFAVSGIRDAYSADGGKELALWKKGTEVIVKFVGLNPVVQVQATLASQAYANL